MDSKNKEPRLSQSSPVRTTPFGRALAQIRMECHLTREGTARALEISVASLKDYEVGKCSPPKAKQESVAQMMGLTIQELLSTPVPMEKVKKSFIDNAVTARPPRQEIQKIPAEMKEKLDKFASWLKKVRAKNKWSRGTLSKAFDVPTGVIASWEYKINPPSMEVLSRLAQVFETTPNKLLAGDFVLSEKVRAKIESYSPRILNQRKGAFGHVLKRLRMEHKGVRQYHIATAMGVSYVTARVYEYGKVMPERHRVAALAEILQISPEELLAGDFKNITELSIQQLKYGLPRRSTPFGKSLVKLRKRMDWSQDSLSAALGGVPPLAIGTYENQGVIPNDSTFERIALALGIPEADLREGKIGQISEAAKQRGESARGEATSNGFRERPDPILSSQAKVFGKSLASLRKENGWGPQVLALAAGISKKNLLSIEAGAMAPPDPKVMAKLSEVLGHKVVEKLFVGEIPSLSAKNRSKISKHCAPQLKARPRTEFPSDVESPIQVFGGRLHNLRMRLGWSQEALGSSIGITLSAISHCEAGRRMLGAEPCSKLLKMLGADLETFMKSDFLPVPEEMNSYVRSFEKEERRQNDAGKVSDALRSFLKLVHWTENDLSKALNIPLHTVKGYIEGSRKPNKATVGMLADFIRRSPDEVFGKTG